MSVSTGNNFVEVDFSIQKIAVVKINRPEAKNALNGEVRKQLAQVFTELVLTMRSMRLCSQAVKKSLLQVQI